jgi:hypothetical protein
MSLNFVFPFQYSLTLGSAGVPISELMYRKVYITTARHGPHAAIFPNVRPHS